LLVDSS